MTFTLLLLIVAALYFVVVYRTTSRVAPGLPRPDTLTISHTARTFTLDPHDSLWATIEPTRVHLLPQAARLPYGKRELDIEVKGAFNDDEIAFLLDFPDRTETRTPAPDPDACAIMFTPAGAPATTQMMGHASAANIWQWLADRDSIRYQQSVDTTAVRELVAAGTGTQNPMNEQDVLGRGAYAGGRWTVVFQRPMARREEGELALTPGSDLQVAFAVWDGAAGESFGIKSISILQHLRFAGDRAP